MTKKYKMLAAVMIFLFIGHYFGTVTASELPENKPQEDDIVVECGLVNSDGSKNIEKFTLSEQEFAEVEAILSELIEELESSTDLDDVEAIINSIPHQGGSFRFKHPVLFWILNTISSYKLPRSRTFVVSHGRSFRINPFKNHKVDTYRPLTLWQYSNQWGFDRPGKTFILRYSPFNTKILHGKQIGMMTHFIGVYIYVSQPPPQKSYTFFIGSARHVGGIDFTYSSSVPRVFPILLTGFFLSSVVGISLIPIISSLFSNSVVYPSADFSYYPVELTTEDIIHFSDKSTDEDGTIESWSWDFEDGHNSIKQNPQHQYMASGTYTVTLEIIDNDGNVNSISKTIIIKNPSTGEKGNGNIEEDTDDAIINTKEIPGFDIFIVILSVMIIIAIMIYDKKQK